MDGGVHVELDLDNLDVISIEWVRGVLWEWAMINAASQKLQELRPAAEVDQLSRSWQPVMGFLADNVHPDTLAEGFAWFTGAIDALDRLTSGGTLSYPDAMIARQGPSDEKATTERTVGEGRYEREELALLRQQVERIDGKITEILALLVAEEASGSRQPAPPAA